MSDRVADLEATIAELRQQHIDDLRMMDALKARCAALEERGDVHGEAVFNARRAAKAWKALAGMYRVHDSQWSEAYDARAAERDALAARVKELEEMLTNEAEVRGGYYDRVRELEAELKPADSTDWAEVGGARGDPRVGIDRHGCYQVDHCGRRDDASPSFVIRVAAARISELEAELAKRDEQIASWLEREAADFRHDSSRLPVGDPELERADCCEKIARLIRERVYAEPRDTKPAEDAVAGSKDVVHAASDWLAKHGYVTLRSGPAETITIKACRHLSTRDVIVGAGCEQCERDTKPESFVHRYEDGSPMLVPRAPTEAERHQAFARVRDITERVGDEPAGMLAVGEDVSELADQMPVKCPSNGPEYDPLADRTYGPMCETLEDLTGAYASMDPRGDDGFHNGVAIDLARHVRDLQEALRTERAAHEQTKREMQAESFDGYRQLRDEMGADLDAERFAHEQTRAELEKLREGVRKLRKGALDRAMAHPVPAGLESSFLQKLADDLRALIGDGG